jgi:cyanophycinase-like exopeptidase
MTFQAELAVLHCSFLKNVQMDKRVRVRFFQGVAILAFGAGSRVMNTERARAGQFPTPLSGEDEQ